VHRSAPAAVRRASGPKEAPLPQDPTACLRPWRSLPPVPTSEEAVLARKSYVTAELVSVPPMSTRPA